MSKTSKRAITILITGMFLLSMIPMTFAAIGIDNDAPTAGTRYNVGDTIVVEGTGVTSGATINLYWDYVTTAGLMNNTQGSPSGGFEVSMDVPDSPAGEHWLWVKDMETSLSESRRVVVDPEVDLSSTSGLVDEELDADGTGYLDDDDVYVYFGAPPVFLLEAGDSTADWATDPATPTQYGDVVKLVGDAGSDSRACVYISGGPTLQALAADWSVLDFAYYAPAAGNIPDIELRFVAPDCVNPDDGSSLNRAHMDVTITPTGAAAVGAWTSAPTLLTTDTALVFGNDPTTGAAWSNFGPTLNDVLTYLSGTKGTAYTTWVLTRISPQVGWGTTGTYYIDDVEYGGTAYNLTRPTDTATSDDDGTWATTFDIPELPDDTTYAVSAVGSGDFWDTHDFTIGAVVTIDIDEGPTGSIVTIEGRGFTASSTLDTVMIDGVPMLTVEDTVGDVTVSGGEFEAEFVIPDVAEGDYTITVEDVGTKSAYADFEVNGEPEIEVEPTYGSPGAVIGITGSNFTKIDGTKVTVKIFGDTVVSAETDSDGAFEDTFVSPAIPFTTYTVTATDEYSIDATDAFKVGLIALIINPIYGEAGTEIAITGIGFEPGVYNLTFGDTLYEEYGSGVSDPGEAISDTFYAPNVEPGVYDVIIIDTAENEMTVQFTVTESTVASIDPAVAPNDYNITLSGYNFADVAGAVTFEIYNSTDDWTMNVYEDGAGAVKAATDTDGNFTGWWIVPAVLSLGDYTINVTDSQDLMVQLSFSVVAARVEVTPRKELFDRGDTITFDISNDFDLPDSYIEIFSPADTLYWITEDLAAAWWVQIEGLYTVPYYRQLANMNPMELQSDAPMGTWTYFFYDITDDELMNGTFEVGPSTAAQVDALLAEVWDDITDLAEDVAGITGELEDDIGALSDEIDDVVADVQDMVDDITADLAGDIAAVANDAREAVEGLQDEIGDIAEAANDAVTAADAATAAATAAETAALDSQQTSQGLTTLVYGAIGASLIAALAAIVSLMQISKKIA